MSLFRCINGLDLGVDSDLCEGSAQRLLSGVFVVRSCTVLNGLITMSFSSTIQILKVNDIEKGVSKKTGQPWERHTAECMLLDDSGEIECVGKLNLPEPLRAIAARGVFRAGFSLVVPTFGDQQGQITARLVSLMPVPGKSAPSVAAAPKP